MNRLRKDEKKITQLNALPGSCVGSSENRGAEAQRKPSPRSLSLFSAFSFFASSRLRVKNIG
ncbi:MAG: hypothetical protein ACLQDI_13630, partial [Syntrophobacteraceae bacterium]